MGGKTFSSLFGINARRKLKTSISFMLLVSILAPWQVFADDFFGGTKENFTPHPYLQPDLATGAFNYTRPIAIPSGRAGIQPDLKLSYSSSRGVQDSFFGYGWSMNIPYIERLNKIGVDKLYNQAASDTYFYSSLSGELLQKISTTTSSSFLGTSTKKSELALLDNVATTSALLSADFSNSNFQTSTPIFSEDTASSTASSTFPLNLAIPVNNSTTTVATSTLPIAEQLDLLPKHSLEDLWNTGSTTLPFVSTTLDDITRPDGAIFGNPEPIEITSLRTADTKDFFLGLTPKGEAQIAHRFYSAPIQFKNPKTGAFEEIDSRFTQTQKGFSVTQAPYNAMIDTTGNQSLLTFGHDGQELHVDSLKAPLALHTKGFKKGEGKLNDHRAIFPDLLDKNVDLEVATLNDRIIKEAVLNTVDIIANTKGDTYDIPFLISSPSALTLTVDGQTLAEGTPITSSSGATITDVNGIATYILPPTMTSSGTLSSSTPQLLSITITYEKTKSGIVMTKHLPMDFLRTALYPVRTDATFTFNSQSGDGVVGHAYDTSWDTCRNATTANYVYATDPSMYLWTMQDGSGPTRMGIARTLLPFNTTGLSASSTIASATLYATAVSTMGSSSAVLVQSNQASSTSIATGDYAMTVNNPAEGAARKSFSAWTLNQYTVWPLNATGTSFIIPGGITKLAIRDAHDVDNSPPGASTYYRLELAFSETPSQAPYLEIITTGGATAPTGLQVNALQNPTDLRVQSPSLSAVYQSTASSSTASAYQIQITTSSTSWSTFTYDSGKISLGTSTLAVGQRSPLLYASSTFPLDGNKYYWRIKFWNENDLGGDGSTTGDYFVMGVSRDYSAKVDDGSFTRYNFTDNMWSAYDKRGVKYLFGTASSSQVVNPSATTSVQTFRWFLDKTIDPNGNTVSYTYATDSAQVYPYKITYTSNGGSNPFYEVEFLRENRPDIATSSLAGFSLATKQRIKEILVRTNGQLTHRYQLTYAAGDNATRSLLISTQESGWNSSVGTTTLPAVQYSYSVASTTWSLNTDSSKWVVPQNYFFTMDTQAFDINGDGLTDFVYHQDNGGANLSYLNTGTSWVQNNSYTAPEVFSGYDSGIRFGDINGDGYVDMVRYHKIDGDNPQIFKSVNLGGPNGFHVETTRWNPPVYFAIMPINGSQTPDRVDEGVRLADVNGDGLADLVQGYDVAQSTPYTAVYINNGSQWVYDPTWTFPVSNASLLHQHYDTRITDLNGDGLADVMSDVAVYINTGHGWAQNPNWVIPSGGGLHQVDINGDGLLDLMGNSQTYINTGTNWTTSAPNLPTGINSGGVVIDDVNGDGLPDVVQNTYITVGQNVKQVWLKNGTKADLLTGIKNEKGGSTNVTYSRTHKANPDGTLPNPSLQIAFDTISTIATDPGFGGTVATTTYAYTGGKYYYANNNDRQFAGFKSSTETNTQGHTTRTSYHQGDTSDTSVGEFGDHVSKIGKPYLIESLDASTTNANLFARTINKWVRAAYDDGRNFVKLVQSVKQTFDGNSDHRDTAQTNTYDDMSGNITESDNYGEVTGNTDGTFSDIGTDKAVTTYTYSASSTNSTMSLPSRELTVDQSGNTVKDTKYTYDNLGAGSVWYGNQTKVEALKSGSSYINTQKVYDAYGNVTQSIDPRGATTTFSYDSYYLYPLTVTNALNQATAYTYDYGTGKVKTTIDPNNLNFQTDYDGLGRTIKEWQPDFTTPSTLVAKTDYVYTESTSTTSLTGNTNTHAIALNGTNQYLQAPNSGSLSITGNVMTIEAWVKFDTSGGGPIVAKRASGDAQLGLESYELSATTNTIRAMFTGDTTHRVDAYYNFTHQTGVWYHLAAVLNGGGVLFYVNGSAYSPSGYYTQWAFGNMNTNTQPLSIGNIASLDDTYFPGSIDDVRIWNTERSASQIAYSKDTELVGNESGLKAYYKLNNSLSDATSNGNTLTAYNGAGFTTNTQPLGATATVVSTPSSLFTRNYLSSATTTDAYTYFDGIGRTLQTKREAEAANGWITSDTKYNNIGTLDKQSLPYFSTSTALTAPTTDTTLYTTYTYDPLGRIKAVSDVFGTTTNTYNDWWMRTTDVLGNNKEFVKDAYGNLAQVVEHATATTSATTTYAYNLLGKLTKITDALANVRNFTYDTLGRLLVSEDLHTASDTTFGTTTTSYDDAGNLMQKITPNNQTINYTYDALNRALTEDWTGGAGIEATYSYDTCTYGKGRLCLSGNQGGATSTLAYNPIGLVAVEGKNIGGVWATTSTTYLRNGAQDILTYPNNRQVQYIYNDAGDLNRVLSLTPASTTWRKIVESINYAPTGQPSFIDYGNNTQTTYTYDPTKRYRLMRKVTVSTSTTPGVPESLGL